MNNFRDALFLLDQLRAIGPPSAKAVNSVAAACARAGQYDRTFSLLKELSERGAWDSFSYTTAITAHGKCRQWAKALALLRTIKEPNEFVFGAAIGACAAAGRWAEAIALLDDMEARGIPSNARCYNGALSACDRADQPEVALRLFEKMRTGEDERIRPTTISYTSAISACARRPSYADRSPALLAQMRRDGLRPNAVTFGATAQAYATLGHWEAALQLLADMEAEGVAPNIVVLSNIVNACAEAAAWKPALALTFGMSSRYGVTPDVACVNAAIKACARAQEPAAALELLDGLGKRANVRSYGTALAALASCVPPRWEEALNLLTRMRSVGLAPSLECHTAALAACGAAREMREVIAIWQGLPLIAI
jgi:pentatricopeptide repeat domain-containing protein 1